MRRRVAPCPAAPRPPAALSPALSDALLADAAEALLGKLEAESKGKKPAEARVYMQVGRAGRSRAARRWPSEARTPLPAPWPPLPPLTACVH
jgi:hypothetical protein